MKGIIGGKSKIDSSFKMFIVYPEYGDYNSVFKPIFNSHGIGFLIPGKKQMYIDGPQMENLTKDHFYAIQAHEIAHYNLKHKGGYTEENELEADIEGYKILISKKYKKAAEILKQRILDFYGEEALKKIDESSMKYVKTYKLFENEDERLHRIRHFQGSIKDLDDYIKSKGVETNPYKDTIMNNGPHQGELDNSLPYQDFQNGNSDLLKNRHGK